jgi:hypothetical protein
MALSMARHAVVRNPIQQNPEELHTLLERLFSLSEHNATFDGKTIVVEISAAQLFDAFQSHKFKS